MDHREILVSLEHGDGTAAVVRDEDGRLWLLGDLRGGGSGLPDYQPHVTGIWGEMGERTVQGGRLPPGAVAADVVDDTGRRRQATAGNGAWVIVLDQPTQGFANPVRFTDAGGETVAPPLPDDWPRVPVEDAEEPCPACGASSWDEVHPLDESRGMTSATEIQGPPPMFGGPPPSLDMQPSPFLVCRVCGHEESIGGFSVVAVAPVAPAEHEDREGVARRAREQEEAARRAREYVEAHHRQMREALSHASFPIYVAEGSRARITGWGTGSRHELTNVKVDQEASGAGPAARVHIETSSEGAQGDQTALVRRALEDMLRAEAGGWPQRSEAGTALWLNAKQREGRRLAALTTIGKHQLLVEGRPEEFALGRAGDRWAAVRCAEGLVVTITAHGVAPDAVTLRLIRDPAGELFESPFG